MHSRHLAGLILFGVASPLLAGCTFIYKSGNGLYTRAQLEDRLAAMAPAEVEDAVDRALAADPDGVSRGSFRVHVDRNDYPWLWAGRRVEYRAGRTVERDDETIAYRDNILTGTNTGILRVIYGQDDIDVYDRETGMGYARQRTRSAILNLIYWGEVIKPTAAMTPLPDRLGPLRWEVGEYDYTAVCGTALGWGLVGWGTKNGRAYGQLLWIPIPLWSAGEQPEGVIYEDGRPPRDEDDDGSAPAFLAGE